MFIRKLEVFRQERRFSFWKHQKRNMASNDIGDWYRGIPQMTKYWFTGSIVVPLVARLGLINPVHLILIFERVAYNFQVIFCDIWYFLILKHLFYLSVVKCMRRCFVTWTQKLQKKKKRTCIGIGEIMMMQYEVWAQAPRILSCCTNWTIIRWWSNGLTLTVTSPP